MARASVKSPDAFRTISEAADALDLPQHVLRFWETRFSQIKPMKRSGGRRYYRPTDIALLQGIRNLLYDEGYTIKGVQRILREQGAAHVAGFAEQVQPVAAAPSRPTPPQPTPAPAQAAQPLAAPQPAPEPAMQAAQPPQSRPDPVRAVLGGRQGSAPSSLRFVPDPEPDAEPAHEPQAPTPPLPLPPPLAATAQPASVEPVGVPTMPSAGQPVAQPSAHPHAQPSAQQAAQPATQSPVPPPAPPMSPAYQDAPITAAQTSNDQRERLIEAYRALADCKQILDQARSSIALTMPAAPPVTSAQGTQGAQGVQALPQLTPLPAKPAPG